MLFESACLLAGPGRSTMLRTMEDVVGSIEWESLSEQTEEVLYDRMVTVQRVFAC